MGTGATGSFFARAVTVSADGNTAAVGSPTDNNFVGATWVFTRSAGVWSQQGTKLIGTGAVGQAGQGTSVAVSADGNTLLEGGSSDNNAAGATWVFTRAAGVWSQQGTRLVGTGATGLAQQGAAVSVSGDGNTALVGGPADNTHAGAAWVFTRSGAVWSQLGSKLVGAGAVSAFGANQGGAVALSADGRTAAVGGEFDNDGPGATWVFKFDVGVWSQYGDKLFGTGGVGGSNQGHSVSLSADGTTLAIGGQADNNYDGAAWVFFDATPIGVPPGPGDDGGPAAAPSLVAFPNPAPGFIRFALRATADQHGPARVHILDVNGRRVKSMEIGRVMRGVTSLAWDGTDDGGKPVVSGTYLIRLEIAGRTSVTAKATIIR